MQIITLEGLNEAADKRQSVVCPKDRCWNRPKPARFVINLSGAVLLRLFNSGMFIYTPKKSS